MKIRCSRLVFRIAFVDKRPVVVRKSGNDSGSGGDPEANCAGHVLGDSPQEMLLCIVRCGKDERSLGCSKSSIAIRLHGDLRRCQLCLI